MTLTFSPMRIFASTALFLVVVVDAQTVYNTYVGCLLATAVPTGDGTTVTTDASALSVDGCSVSSTRNDQWF
jgi:hypothetical protein